MMHRDILMSKIAPLLISVNVLPLFVPRAVMEIALLLLSGISIRTRCLLLLHTQKAQIVRDRRMKQSKLLFVSLMRTLANRLLKLMMALLKERHNLTHMTRMMRVSLVTIRSRHRTQNKRWEQRNKWSGTHLILASEHPFLSLLYFCKQIYLTLALRSLASCGQSLGDSWP